MKNIHFDETYGENPAENYERFFVPSIGQPLAQDLIHTASLKAGERVLDVACGTGIISRLALKEVGQSGSITGLDINPGMLGVSRSISQDSTISWIEASAENMPFPDMTFDVVICQISLQFMEDKSVALREMRRVLVPDGRLFINVPGPAGPLFSIFAEALKRHISPEAAGFVNHVFSLYDTAEIRQLLQDANFHNIEIDTENKTLHLPAPKEFLWQYIHSTPMFEVVFKSDEKARIRLEGEIEEKWQKFESNGNMQYQQEIVTVSAQK